MTHPKPAPHAVEKRGRKEEDHYDIGRIRARVFALDMDCRFPDSARRTSPCSGQHDLAHLRSHSRAKTGGQPAAERWKEDAVFRCCRKHHRMYDGMVGGRLVDIETMTPQGTRGPMKFYDYRTRAVLGIG